MLLCLSFVSQLQAAKVLFPTPSPVSRLPWPWIFFMDSPQTSLSKPMKNARVLAQRIESSQLHHVDTCFATCMPHPALRTGHCGCSEAPFFAGGFRTHCEVFCLFNPFHAHGCLNQLSCCLGPGTRSHSHTPHFGTVSAKVLGTCMPPTPFNHAAVMQTLPIAHLVLSVFSRPFVWRTSRTILPSNSNEPLWTTPKASPLVSRWRGEPGKRQ